MLRYLEEYKKTILIILFCLAVISVSFFLRIKIENNKTNEIFLTNEERNWLKENNNKIKIGYTTDYNPVEFIKEDKYVGISADYFSLLEKKLNFSFQMVEFSNWNNLINEAKEEKIQGITAATKTENRSEYLNFTLPYIQNPNVIITRKNFSEELNFEKLSDSTMKVLVVKEYAIIDYIKEKYPKLEYETVKTASEGLRKVSFGEADAMIIEVMSAVAAIEKDNISNLIVNSETSYESNLSIATTKKYPILNKILNKGLAQISNDEKQTIIEKWIPFERKEIFDNKYFWFFVFALAIILISSIIFIIIWNNTLQRAVDEKTLELKNKNIKLREATKKLKESEKRFEALSKYSTDIIARFDSNLRHLYVNPAIKKITNLSVNDFIGKRCSELDFPLEIAIKWENALRKVFKTKKPQEIEFQIYEYYYHWLLMPEFSDDKKEKSNYVSAVITSGRDITERKKTEEEIEYKSYHDELTGLKNRAYFNKMLYEYTKEKNLPLGIILADLNGLKITNDTLGHHEGDRLLKKVANIFKEACKGECNNNSLISRIGGDEFLILLPNKNKKQVRKLCSNIKKLCLNSKKDPIKPSVALGYSVKKDDHSNFQVLFKKAEDNMYENKMYESESANNSILNSLETMLRETTNETLEHSTRLRGMAIGIGKELGLSDQELNALSSLADLHDLGKIAISEEILSKPGPLSESEWKKMKRHPELGFKIANSSPKLSQIAEGILSHHERWDGKGYPQGLKGEDIPLLARIITIVDSYDVMTNGRPYKKPLTKEEAIQELKDCSEKQFDKKLVDIFINKVIN